jgi:hypothetical protein
LRLADLRLTDGGRGERFSRKRSDTFYGIDDIGLRDSHLDHPSRDRIKLAFIQSTPQARNLYIW